MEFDMGMGMGDFSQSAIGIGGQGAQISQQTSQQQMAQMAATGVNQMEQQMFMGLMQQAIKLNEALAKMFKALGEAIKNLA
jgi:hypothetical protein